MIGGVGSTPRGRGLCGELILRRRRPPAAAPRGARWRRDTPLAPSRQNGKRHRTDGPAVEWPDGTREWWLEGVPLSEGEHRAQIAALVTVQSGARSRVGALAG